MTNILQNVTKDNILLQLKRIAVGAALVLPLAAIGFLVMYLVTNNYINGMTLYVSFQSAMIILVLWTLGGAYESYRAMKEFQQHQEDRKTERAFEKLSNGNT